MTRPELFCFPHAGGGASWYREWSAQLVDVADVRAVQLPGRENRMREPPFRTLAPLLDALAETVRPEPEQPFALLGHSMGALIAFELARRFQREGSRAPLCLFVSGYRAPHLPNVDAPIHDLPEPELLDRLRDLDGTPEEILRHRELLDLVLPVIRADLAVCETYVHVDGPRLACPIAAFGGAADPKVPVQDLAAWRTHTTGPFSMHLFRGGHFFLHDDTGAALAHLAEHLSTLAQLSVA